MTELKSQLFASLDIGATKTILLVGSKDLSGIANVHAFGTVLYKDIIDQRSLGILSTRHLIIKALQKINDMSPAIEIPPISVALSANFFTSTHYIDSVERKNTETGISREELNMLVAGQKERLLPSGEIPAGLFVKGFVNGDIKHNKTVEGLNVPMIIGNFHLLTIRQKEVDRISQLLLTLKLTIKNFVCRPVASALAILENEDFEAGVIVADIGALSTEVCIYRFGILYHTAIIYMGGNNVTRDIEHAFGIGWYQAEELKKNFGIATSEIVKIGSAINIGTKQKVGLFELSQVIQARMEKILNAVIQEITVAGIDENFLGGGIRLTGGGALQKGLPDLCAHITTMKTKVTKYHALLSKDEAVNTPTYSAAIGPILNRSITQQL